ncbi:hypothetical protein N7532_007655 [Penicillium argentinense]|uniref:MINDY deubiquitinase domain-containing protein n=1 Tax=Penicillium argentinense TaxID=1131581 RepID=A0A9W9EW44_9EURO|nr:uncharacterized protein N7532_007655 [Penicillium argentinense]KAJ5088971.1 hypothetical protein N7532_007655 [Penicillium argentinense]
MVLRKPPPPRLENLHKWHARTESRSPTSPSSHSSSSQRRTRPHRVPSQESVYSPDLNTSPAFDLMPLEQAQRSPVGSPTSHPPSSWSDGLADRPATGDGAYPAGSEPKGHGLPGLVPGPPESATGYGWQPVSRDRSSTTGEVPVQLQSNNPFLKPRPMDSQPDSADPLEWTDRHSHATTNSDPLSQAGGYIPMTARLSLLDSSEHESPWTEHELSQRECQRSIANPQPYDPSPWTGHDNFRRESQQFAAIPQSSDPSPWGSQHSIKISAPQEIYLQGGQSNPYAPAPAVVVQPSDTTQPGSFDPQPPFDHDRLASDAGVRTPSAFSSATSATSHELIDVDVPDSLAAGSESHRATSSVYSSEGADKAVSNLQSPSLVSSNVQLSASGLQNSTQLAPARKLSPAEEAKQQKQRRETYSIRQINRTDRHGNLVQSPVLVQNENGPCPLLALINALVLRADPKIQPPIVKALRTREQISLGLLIEALFDELTTGLRPDQDFPDIEALTQFLTMLHTGLNVNPRLTLETEDSLGTFLQTPDLQLYSTFGIPLIHGWVTSWSDPAHDAMVRVGQYHEDIQLLHFNKQELEDRVMRGQSLSPDEEQKMADIQVIQHFVEIENATQLSPFGLTQLTTRLAPGSISILFRNDHFSTLYKHPESHKLFTLVTDAGYSSHAEVVWESLVDVTGFNAEFLAGDFRAVGHGPSGSSGPAAPAGPHNSSLTPNNPTPAEEGSHSPLSTQEQSDADYAYALSLQFQEEEQREQQGNQPERDQQEEHQPERGPRPSGLTRPLGSTRLSNSSSRMSSPRISGPNRTSSIATGLRHPHSESDPDDPNAPPPPYEQAASGPRYSPPERRNRYSDFPVDANGSYSPRYPQNRYSNRPVHDRYSADRVRSKDCIVM